MIQNPTDNLLLPKEIFKAVIPHCSLGGSYQELSSCYEVLNLSKHFLYIYLRRNVAASISAGPNRIAHNVKALYVKLQSRNGRAFKVIFELIFKYKIMQFKQNKALSFFTVPAKYHSCYHINDINTGN